MKLFKWCRQTISSHTKVILPAYQKQEFTLKEALKYIAEEKKYYLFDDMVLYNIPLRDELRTEGAERLMNRLKKLAPDEKDLWKEMDRFIQKYTLKGIADFDIRLVPCSQSIEILGYKFQGLSDISQRAEMSLSRSGNIYPLRAHTLSPAPVHVGEASIAYPCFDSSDFMYEDRSYQNYLLRDHPITQTDMRKLAESIVSQRTCMVSEDTPEYLLPMVYYRGEGELMLVATRKKGG